MVQILYSYFRCTSRLFLGCALFVARCNIIRAPRETKKKRLSYRKKCKEEFVCGTSRFWLNTLLSMSIYVDFFIYLLPPLKWRVAEWPVSIYVVLLWVVFCVMMSWVNGRKYENPLQFNTSWLASLRMWFYFRLCFSFTCSGYDFPTLSPRLCFNIHSIGWYY